MKLFVLSVSLIFSFKAFSNAHVECNLTNTNLSEKLKAEKQIEDAFRTPDTVRERNSSSSLDGGESEEE